MEVTDPIEPQPLKTLEAIHVRSHLLERFNKLKKWQEEQQERLRSIQKLQWQKLHEQEKYISAIQNKKLANYDDKNTNISNFHNELGTGLSSTTTEIVQKSKECIPLLKETRCIINGSDDNRPIQPGISAEKSFEELLEKELLKDRSIHFEQQTKSMKRPYLKKGSGLKRYNIKAPQKLIKKPSKQLISKLKLKKETKQNNFPSVIVEKHNMVTSHKNIGNISQSEDQNYLPIKEMDLKEMFQEDSSFIKDCERLKKEHQKESVELAEFEMLEAAAHNISSESSLSAYVAKRYQSPKVDKELNLENFQDKRKDNSVEILQGNLISQTTQLEKLLTSVKNRHQFLQQKMANVENNDLDTNSDNANKLSIINEEHSIEEILSDSESSSNSLIQNDDDKDKSLTEVESEDKLFDDESSWKDSIEFENSESVLSSTLRNDNSDNEQNSNSVTPTEEKEEDVQRKTSVECNANNVHTVENILQKEIVQCNSVEISNEMLLAERYHLQKKSKELEEEIEVFKKENALLISLSKQREEMIKQLQKEKKEFEKFKTEMEKKLQDELTEGRKQLRRERQNFERYQKLKKDYPDKKEREVISTLRQQVEKLQNDMKKQENKWSLECRRLQNKLSVIEKERDSLKIAVKQLESQRVELLALLKENQKKPQTKKEIINNNNSNLVYKTEIINHAKTSIRKHSEENDSDNEKENKYIRTSSNNERKKISEVLKSAQESKEKLPVNTTKPKQFPSKKNLKVHFNTEPLKNKDNQKESNQAIKIQNSLETKDILKEAHSDMLENKFTNADKEVQHLDKIEKQYDNGDKEYIFPSGTKKRISADGLTTTINFYNGDWKQILPDQRIIYYYADKATTQTIYPDGLQIIEFANGQIETHHPNGVKNVVLGDSQYTLYPDGSEENVTSDGTIIRISPNGVETVHYTNGEIEIRSSEFKKREYPDGTVKIIYADGRQETRYANGRMRIKGKDGDVLLDVELPRS